MKKIFILSLLFFGLQGFAQKTLYIYNFSSYSMTVAYIQTNATGGSGALPWLNNNPNGTPSLLITIPSGSSYTLQNPSNATRFPFLDASGASPVISGWCRKSTSGGVYSSPLTTTAAWTAYGSGQELNYVKFSTSSGGTSGGNIGNGFNGGLTTFTTGNGLIDADYVVNVPSIGQYEYTVVLTDH